MSQPPVYPPVDPPGGPPWNPSGSNPYEPGAPPQPYGAPQHPGGPPPYGVPGPYGPGYGPPPKKDNTLKWVLIIIGTVLLLTCGGCLAVGVLAFNEGSSIVERELDRVQTSESIDVEEGDGFSLGNLDVQDGWRTVNSEFDDSLLDVVVTTRPRDDPAFLDSVAQIDFSFYRRDRLLGTIGCFGFDVKANEPTALDCAGSVEKIKRADRITAETPFS